MPPTPATRTWSKRGGKNGEARVRVACGGHSEGQCACSGRRLMAWRTKSCHAAHAHFVTVLPAPSDLSCSGKVIFISSIAGIRGTGWGVCRSAATDLPLQQAC